MPPKAKVSRDMTVEAAFAVAREGGADNVNARSVASKLGCSTQPVMRQFNRIEELKRAAFERADVFHTEYLMRPAEGVDSMMLSIGLNYVRFAAEESNLFRFLFQSGFGTEGSLLEMLDAPGLEPVLEAMQREMQLSRQQTREVFTSLALCVHGYASLIANSSLEYDEQAIADQLRRIYTGAMLALREDLT